MGVTLAAHHGSIQNVCWGRHFPRALESPAGALYHVTCHWARDYLSIAPDASDQNDRKTLKVEPRVREHSRLSTALEGSIQKDFQKEPQECYITPLVSGFGARASTHRGGILGFCALPPALGIPKPVL